jgi:hypothetical protein
VAQRKKSQLKQPLLLKLLSKPLLPKKPLLLPKQHLLPKLLQRK